METENKIELENIKKIGIDKYKEFKTFNSTWKTIIIILLLISFMALFKFIILFGIIGLIIYFYSKRKKDDQNK